jgi:hypothetical protein
MRITGSICAALLLLVTTTAGCIFIVSTNPDEFPVVSNELETLPAGTKVEIVNNYPPNHVVRVDGIKFDLHQMTGTAVVVLGRALEARGAVLATGGKRITLEVAAPGWVQGYGGYYARGTMSLNAYFGGQKVSTWGEHTGGSGSTNFNAAITQAVEAMLRKQELSAHLRNP